MIKANALRSVATTILFFLSFSACADVYKCADGDATVYSENFCGKNAVLLKKIEAPVDAVANVDSNAGLKYVVNGFVGKLPVSFVVDTGASTTALPEFMLAKAGIGAPCVPKTFDTANGRVSACVATIPEVRVGGILLNNLEVAFMPSLSSPLLGMNAITLMKIDHITNRTILFLPSGKGLSDRNLE